MTVQEAVELVIQAGAIGGGGDALVLDMGDPVRIMDVARRLVAGSDTLIDIVQTGLRPGEKLHEVLLGRDERARPTTHPVITAVSVPPLAVEAVAGLDAGAPTEVVVDQLRRAAVADVADEPVAGT
jgi:FlaA1/EpsC-like NDP-sugar epimerase